MKSINICIVYVCILICNNINFMAATSATIAVSETPATTPPTTTPPTSTPAATPAATPAVTTPPAVATPAPAAPTTPTPVTTPAATTPAVTTPTPTVATVPTTPAATTPVTPAATTPPAVATPAPAVSITSTPATPAARTKSAEVPIIQEKTKQILISVYIQNNYHENATLDKIELLITDRTTPLIKDNLKIPLSAAKNIYSKGSVTAFDLAAEANKIASFNGIQSITINGDQIVFANIRTGISLSHPIAITKINNKWVIDKK